MKMENRKKWMISKLNINKEFGLNYEWILEFKVWNVIYSCTNINEFIKEILIWNIIQYEIFLDKLYWVDFRVYSKNKDSEWITAFEIQIIDSYINKNKVISLLKWNKIKMDF